MSDYRPLTPEPQVDINEDATVNKYEPRFVVKNYGIEYKRLIDFDCEVVPSGKVLKLDQPEVEEITLKNVLVDDHTTKPIPSYTPRNYCSVPIKLDDIPDVCLTCFAINCVCELIARIKRESS